MEVQNLLWRPLGWEQLKVEDILIVFSREMQELEVAHT